MFDCEEGHLLHFILVPATSQKSSPGMCTHAAISICSHMLPSQDLGLAQVYLPTHLNCL